MAENRTPFREGNSLVDNSGWSVTGLGLYFTAPTLTSARVLAGQLNAAFQLGYLQRLAETLPQEQPENPDKYGKYGH